VWVRHDLPGREACRLLRIAAGWRLDGVAVLADDGRAYRLDYSIECDPDWVTRSAGVRAWAGNRTIDVLVVRDRDGQWKLNGCVCEGVAGCMDIDLNFSPSTNLLPIRRLDLAVGASAQVRAAWLTFPGFQLEPLEQSYTRLGPERYRYESSNGGFQAEVTVDPIGLVIEYGKLWSRAAGFTDA
jgi:hypothetical protein